MALRRAAQIAGDQAATFSLLHVTDSDNLETRSSTEGAEEKLRQHIAKYLPNEAAAGGVRVVAGKPFVEIIRGARDEAADLVVLGAHGEHFLKDLLLGTTAEKVVRKGDRPVLIVKRPPHGPYQHVLAAVDFSENSRHAFELALRLAPKAEFQVVHVYQGYEKRLKRAGIPAPEVTRRLRPLIDESKRNMEAFLRSIDYGSRSIRQVLWDGRAQEEITTLAKRLRAELVAVGTTGRTGLPYILLGSVAEHVLREVSCDILVARAEASRFELP
jgi:nucleotide-binding universal stress UspA family protein